MRGSKIEDKVNNCGLCGLPMGGGYFGRMGIIGCLGTSGNCLNSIKRVLQGLGAGAQYSRLD